MTTTRRPTAPPHTGSRGHLLAVVGTDTGVGKTVVSAGILHALRNEGLSVAAFKPVETGLPPGDTPAQGLADWQLLAAATGQEPRACLGCSYPLPAAPLAAARAAGAPPPDIPAITNSLQTLRAGVHLLLLEGAGGLCVPYTQDLLWADLLSRWGAQCLLVGRLGLGTINHTLLTLAELRRRAIPTLGVVLSSLDTPGPETPHTPHLIEAFAHVPLLGIIPSGSVAPPAVAEVLTASGVTHLLTSLCRTD